MKVLKQIGELRGMRDNLAGELIRFGDRVAMGNSRGMMSRMISRLMVEGWYHSGSQETLEIELSFLFLSLSGRLGHGKDNEEVLILVNWKCLEISNRGWWVCG